MLGWTYWTVQLLVDPMPSYAQLLMSVRLPVPCFLGHSRLHLPASHLPASACEAARRPQRELSQVTFVREVFFFFSPSALCQLLARYELKTQISTQALKVVALLVQSPEPWTRKGFTWPAAIVNASRPSVFAFFAREVIFIRHHRVLYISSRALWRLP